MLVIIEVKYIDLSNDDLMLVVRCNDQLSLLLLQPPILVLMNSSVCQMMISMVVRFV